MATDIVVYIREPIRWLGQETLWSPATISIWWPYTIENSNDTNNHFQGLAYPITNISICTQKKKEESFTAIE